MRIITIEDFLRDIIVSWRRIRRWQGKSEATHEDDLMHSFKTAIQALVVLAIEDNEEIKNQRLEILTLALNHDVSEACLGGDVIKPIKDRLHGVVDEIEAEEFDKRFSELPPDSAKFLKSINHIQGNDTKAGRFFEAVEYLGYTSFAIAEISRGLHDNGRQFKRVAKKWHERMLETCKEFSSFDLLYKPMIIPFDSGEVWNIENHLRKIINSWESSRAWPEFPTEETVLERTMKTAMLASILIPIELKKIQEEKKEKFDGFLILATALVHNFAKSIMGVLPHRLKTHSKFRREEARKIEREKFLEVIEHFPKSAKELMTQAFDLEHDPESFEGRFFDAIKILSYTTFALCEYDQGNEQYKEVLENCLPQLRKYDGEFKRIDMFLNPIKHRIESIVEGKPRIWVEVK